MISIDFQPNAIPWGLRRLAVVFCPSWGGTPQPSEMRAVVCRPALRISWDSLGRDAPSPSRPRGRGFCLLIAIFYSSET